MNALRGEGGPRYRHRWDAAAPAYRRITVDPLTPAIGAEIGGVDLAAPLDDTTFAEIADALARHLVIFFRDQKLTPAQHLAFGRRFGALHLHPAAPQCPPTGATRSSPACTPPTSRCRPRCSDSSRA